jgi:hypothetical protein
VAINFKEMMMNTATSPGMKCCNRLKIALMTKLGHASSKTTEISTPITTKGLESALSPGDGLGILAFDQFTL